MSDVVWRVVVARDIDKADEQALARVGATYISGHSGPGLTSSSLLVRADDEAAARQLIETALEPHAFIREARAMPVFVYAPIPAEARTTFEEAACDEPRVGGVIEDENTGELEVCFELPPGAVDAAFNEARGLYERFADIADVAVPTPLDMRMSGFDALMTQPSKARARLERARELNDRGEHDVAVVLAQTACEMLINDVLLTLAQPHVTDEMWPWVLDRIRNFTLLDNSTKELWNRVAGSKIQAQPFWADYDAHVKRRHGIVHRGETVSSDEARRSLDTADAVIDYVERAIGAAPPPARPD